MSDFVGIYDYSQSLLDRKISEPYRCAHLAQDVARLVYFVNVLS